MHLLMPNVQRHAWRKVFGGNVEEEEEGETKIDGPRGARPKK